MQRPNQRQEGGHAKAGKDVTDAIQNQEV